MAIKNVIFDIGNVMTVFAWEQHFKNHGITGETFEKVKRATVGNPVWNEIDRGVLSLEEIIRKMSAIEPSVASEIREIMTDMRGMVTPEDFAIPWVQELKARGLNVYYLSNFSDQARKDCPDALEFTKYTDGGVFSYLEKLIKPDKAIYQLLLDRYDLVAEECVFLDDTEKNLKPAQELGIHTIHVLHHEQAVEELEALLNQ